MQKKTCPKITQYLLVVLTLCAIICPAFAPGVKAEGTTKAQEARELINPLEGGESPAQPVNYRAHRDDYDPAFFEAGLAYYQEIAGYAVHDFPENHVIKKWISPLRIGFDGSLPEQYVKVFERFAKDLNALENLPEIELVPKKTQASNVKIFIDKAKTLARRYFNGQFKDNSAYYLNWTGEPPYRIYSGHIGLAKDRLDEAEIEMQIQANILHVLGLMSKSPSYEDSIFNTENIVSQPSALDWLVLEMHYSPELKPGMDFDRAVEILENIYLGDDDYKAEDEEPSDAELRLERNLKLEEEQVEKCRKLWSSFGVEANPEGERQAFYERREDIDPEFFIRALAYYEEVAGYGEFDDSHDGYVKKWDSPIKLFYEFADEEIPELVDTLERVVKQINSVPGMPELTISNTRDEHYDIYLLFDTLDGLFAKLPGAPEGNWGFFNYFWASDPLYQITSANIGIAVDVTTEVTAKHLLQEELIQCLGLINDSYKYRDSIFHQEWGHILYPSELDWLLLEFHYNPEIKAGMPMDEALEVLAQRYLGKSADEVLNTEEAEDESAAEQASDRSEEESQEKAAD